MQVIKSKTYYLNVNGSYGYITLTENGVVSIVSDYGNYGYIWSSRGPATIEEFLIRCEFDYIQNKFGYGLDDDFDLDKTIDSVKEILKKEYPDGIPSGLQFEIDELSETSSIDGFLRCLEIDCNGMGRILESHFDYVGEVCEFSTKSDLLYFMKIIWPAFIEELKKQQEGKT